MIDDQPNTIGLSDDYGWQYEERPRLIGIHAVALMLGHGAYWTFVWLLAGLVPLPMLASRTRQARRGDTRQ